MSKLSSMQSYAEKLLAKAGVDRTVSVRWAGDTCKLSRRCLAHAHLDTGDICVRRGLKDWRETIQHEVAHLVPGGNGHRQSFTRTLARIGNKEAKEAIREYDIAVKGVRHRHNWIRWGIAVHVYADRKGLHFTYRAKCSLCHRVIPLLR